MTSRHDRLQVLFDPVCGRNDKNTQGSPEMAYVRVIERKRRKTRIESDSRREKERERERERERGGGEEEKGRVDRCNLIKVAISKA